MATPSSDDVPGSADRISPRHMFETRIWIRLQRDGKKLSLQGWSRDLSESGVGAFVAEALMLSESVTLEIPLPDSQTSDPGERCSCTGNRVRVPVHGAER
jgi:hypothetical protein